MDHRYKCFLSYERKDKMLDWCENCLGMSNRNSGLKSTFATREGITMLSDTLKLSNVLYVPSLKCNLIQVSQLIDELSCKVQFTDKFCVIQYHMSRMVIGASEQKVGCCCYCKI